MQLDVQSAPSTPGSGSCAIYVDATKKRLTTKDDAGATVIYPTSDTTAPTTKAFGDTAAAGTNTDNFARVDHLHGMPVAGTNLDQFDSSHMAVALTTFPVFPGSSTPINTAAYIDFFTNVGHGTLAQGTWLVLVYVTCNAANLAFLAHVAVRDDSNHVLACASKYVPASGSSNVNAWVTIALACFYTVPVGGGGFEVSCARGLTTLTNTWNAAIGSGFDTANNADDLGFGSSFNAIQLA
jgi:hypothetical protein